MHKSIVPLDQVKLLVLTVSLCLRYQIEYVMQFNETYIDVGVAQALPTVSQILKAVVYGLLPLAFVEPHAEMRFQFGLH